MGVKKRRVLEKTISCIKCYFLQQHIKSMNPVQKQMVDAETQTEDDIFSVTEKDDDDVCISIVPKYIDISVASIDIKTEDKQKDTLFVSDHLVSHFVRDPAIMHRITTYEGRYISLRLLRKEVDHHLQDVEPEVYDNIVDLFYFLQNKKPFYKKFNIEHHYGLSEHGGVITSHRREIFFVFTISPIQ